MHFDYNRVSFRSVVNAPGVHSLAVAYCSCVLLELSLKQHLNLASCGHDLPHLILRLGLAHRRHQTACNALQRQLSDALRKLFCQDKNGSHKPVPSHSYPYIRNLRNSSDWTSFSSSDTDLLNLENLLQRIISYLSTQIGINV